MGIIRTTFRFEAFAGGIAGAVGLYEANRLAKRYPFVEQPNVQTPSGLRRILPPSLTRA